MAWRNSDIAGRRSFGRFLSISLLLVFLATSSCAVLCAPSAVRGPTVQRAPSTFVALAGTQLTLTPTNGSVGSVVAVNGTGFSANSTVSFTFDGSPITSNCSTDGNGVFPGTSGTPCTFVVPVEAAGPENVVASTGGGAGGVSAQINVGVGPGPIAYDSVQGEIWVANTNDGNVSVIAASNGTVVANIAVGPDLDGIAYDSGTGQIFVASASTYNVSVISDTTDAIVANVTPGGSDTLLCDPVWITYDPAVSEVFVGDQCLHEVSVIDDANDTVVATISVTPGSEVSGLAYDSGTGQVFEANSGYNDVGVIDTATNSLITNITVGSSPYGLAYDSGTGEIFVANDDSSNVTVLSDATDTVVANVSVGNAPYNLAYDPGAGDVFVTNSFNNNVSAISDSTDAVVQTYNVGSGPEGIVFDSATNSVFTANTGSSNVTEFPLGGAGTSSSAPFVVIPSVSLSTPTGTADVGQTVNVTGSGFGSSALVSVLTLDSIAVNCTTARIGTCALGVITTASNGSFAAQFVAPPVGTSGAYSVVVTDIARNSASATITVYPDPTVSSVRALPGSADVGQAVTFLAVPTGGSGVSAFLWQGLPAGCSGTTASVACPSNDIVVGNYTINATLTDTNGVTSAVSANLAFTVSLDPTVTTPVANRTSADVGQSVSFSTTAAHGSGILAYAWTDLPTGCTSSSVASLDCTASGAGTFGVTAQVTDGNGLVVVSGALSFVVYADPSAQVTASRTGLDVGQSVEFTAAAGNGSGDYTYAWIGLPAGCTGTRATVNCTVSSSGPLSVQVTVTDSNGGSTTSSAVGVTVATALAATLSATPTPATTGQSVSFDVTTSGGTGPIGTAWVFGDGSTGSGATTSHTYSSSGTYTVRVWANDSAGESVLKTLTLNVTSGSSGSSPSGSSTPTWEWDAVAGVAVLAVVLVAVLLLTRRGNRGTPPEKST
jgi:YVTN family beta-propeller protein